MVGGYWRRQTARTQAARALRERVATTFADVPPEPPALAAVRTPWDVALDRLETGRLRRHVREHGGELLPERAPW